MQELLVGPPLASGRARTAADLVGSRASIGHIEAFQAKPSQHAGPTPENFTLDLTSQNGYQSPWNMLAQKVFISWFLESKEQYRGKEKAVGVCFSTYFKTIQAAYRNTNAPAEVRAARG